MTTAEFERWWVYHQETPIDFVSRHHVPLAQIAMILANANRDRKQRPEPFEVEDFMPYGPLEDISTPALSQEELDAKLLGGLTEVAAFFRKD